MRVETFYKVTTVATGAQDYLEYVSNATPDKPEHLVGCELLGYNLTTMEGLCVVMNVYMYVPNSWGCSLKRHFSADSGIQFIAPKPITFHNPLRLRGIFNSVINGYALRMNVILAKDGEQ